MGTTEAKISANFLVLAKLPYGSGPINFPKLDRKVKRWLRQLKSSLTNKKVKKHLFCKGFTPDELKSLFNSVLNKTVNASNVTGYAALLNVIHSATNKIQFIPPLHKLYKLYRRALLTDRPSAGKYVNQIALIVSITNIALKQQSGEIIDAQVLKSSSSKINSLEQQYIAGFFPYLLTRERPDEVIGADFISSGGELGYVVDDTTYSSLALRSSYGIYKTDGEGFLAYIPSDTLIIPFVQDNSIIVHKSITNVPNGLVPLSEWVITNKDNVTQDGNWYHFKNRIFLLPEKQENSIDLFLQQHVQDYCYYVGANLVYPPSTPEEKQKQKLERARKVFDIGADKAQTFVIFNNINGIKSSGSNTTVFNSEGHADTTNQSVQYYSEVFNINSDNMNSFSEIALSEESRIIPLGAYGYLIYNTDSDEAKLEGYDYLSQYGGIYNLNHYTL